MSKIGHIVQFWQKLPAWVFHWEIVSSHFFVAHRHPNLRTTFGKFCQDWMSTAPITQRNNQSSSMVDREVSKSFFVDHSWSILIYLDHNYNAYDALVRTIEHCSWYYPASTRRGTDVIFMLVCHVEITSGNMWKCLVFSTSDFLSQSAVKKLDISTNIPM